MRKEETLAAVWQSNLSNLPVRQSLHLCGGGPGGGGGLRRRARAHAAGVRSAEGPPPPVKSNLMFYLALKIVTIAKDSSKHTILMIFFFKI